jgi:hypothetical protein
MINGLFDTCAICGQRAIKPGAGLCRWHEIRALVELSYERMIERNRGNVPARCVIGQPQRNGASKKV